MVGKAALIVKLGQIGDVIMAIPAAHALHEQGFEIQWVCGQAVLSLLECYSWMRPIVTKDKAILFGSTRERLGGIVDLWRKLAFSRFDLCATLYYDRRYRVLTLPVLAKRRLFLSQRSRDTTLLPGRHHTDEYLRVLLGREDTCHDESAAPIRPDRLPPSPIPSKMTPRRIAIVPGGVNHLIREQALARLPEQSLRRWPLENYVELTRALLDRGWEVMLTGGPDDAWVRLSFRDLPVLDWIGKLSISEVISAYDSCDAVVSHDTGPLHLAGLSNARLLGIFGPTDPATRIPRRPFAVSLWGGQNFACRPCYDGRDFAPCRSNKCIQQITANVVLQELDRLLEA